MTQPDTKHSLLDDYHLLSYDVLDSTNEEAKRLAGGGASHGAVIWAKNQTAGKGRMGRVWESEDGNLFVSVLLSPECDLPECSQLSFVAAVATVDTLKPIIPGDEAIEAKWPNDVLLEGKKLGGILLESFTTIDEDGDDRQWVVVGVGVNVDSFPEETMFPATCLTSSGVEIISAKIVLSRFVYNFIHRYDEWVNHGFDPIRQAWEECAYGLNEAMEAHVGDEVVSGSFDSIDEFGRLHVLQKNGKVEVVTAGDVFFRQGK